VDELQGTVTFSYRQNNENYKHDLYITVKDSGSRIEAIEIKVNAESISEVFSGLAEVPVSYEPCSNPERLGKTRTSYKVTLPVPKSKDREAMANRVIAAWHTDQPNRECLFPSYYLDSQDSFTYVSDGNYNVNFTVRRYD
jgi:hypothetical protein